MDIKYKFRVLISIITLCFASASCSAETSTKSPYPIMDSGAWADSSDTTANIYWIDNERVLFKTVKDNNKRLANEGPFNLSIWEIGKGVTPYTPFAHKVSACLRDGIIRYTLEDKQKNKEIFHGKFGEEKLIESPPKMSYYDFMNCRIENNPEIAEKTKNNRRIIKLLDRHGYIDSGAIRGKESREKSDLLFYRNGRREPYKLSTRISGVDEYYVFRDAYFGSYLEPTIGEPGLGWWLHPDGKVETFEIPSGTWQLGIVRPTYPTKAGIFMISHAYKSGKVSGKAGGYLLDGKLSKIIDGSLYDAAVSPDGCKVAFSHAPYFDADIASGDDRTLRTLKVINVCQRRK